MSDIDSSVKSIDGRARTVRELLDKAKYSIDFYQREYAWQERQVRELIDDLTGKFLDSYDPGHSRHEVEGYGHYFLGSVVISHKRGKVLSRRRRSSGESKAIAIWVLSFTPLEANRNLLTAMRLLPESIHWCRRYPTKFNSGRDIPLPQGPVCSSMRRGHIQIYSRRRNSCDHYNRACVGKLSSAHRASKRGLVLLPGPLLQVLRHEFPCLRRLPSGLADCAGSSSHAETSLRGTRSAKISRGSTQKPPWPILIEAPPSSPVSHHE